MGLPKSGTTLIESILRELGAVDTFRSVLRRSEFLPNDKHPHAICPGFFKHLPPTKYSFIKTHTHFSSETLDLVRAFDLKAFVVIRDLRDVMISRYYHVLADPKHWQHQELVGLSTEEGFIRSLYGTKSHPENPINYFSDWIVGHVQSVFPILRYEQYQEDPQNYVFKVASYAGISITDEKVIKILDNLTTQRKALTQTDLSHNLAQPGRKKTTMRKGLSGGWQDFFSDRIYETFMRDAARALELAGYQAKRD